MGESIRASTIHQRAHGRQRRPFPESNTLKEGGRILRESNDSSAAKPDVEPTVLYLQKTCIYVFVVTRHVVVRGQLKG